MKSYNPLIAAATSILLGAGAPPVHSDAPVVVGVLPCAFSSGVKEGLGASVTDTVLTTLTNMSSVRPMRIVDRSLTGHVVSEQDFILSSGAPAKLPPRFANLGAQQLLVIRLLDISAGWLLTLQLVDVATGETLVSATHQAPSERKLLTECGGWAKALWETATRSRSTGDKAVAVDPLLEALWHELDKPEVRVLLGSDLDRAESVYRQYCRAVGTGSSQRADRLSDVAGPYLTDCLFLLRSALHPPEGMVYVPPGWVNLSLLGGDARRFRVSGFFIDRCAYTRGQYAGFLAATGRSEPLGWSHPVAEAARLPVVGVDWYDAEAAARWRGMRLATYAEWLRALVGDTEQEYPWGDNWRVEHCNFARDPRRPVLEPVGSHPENASRFGVLDGVGGVFEWLDSWHSSDYWDEAPEKNPRGPQQGSAKMAVGGSYRSGPGGCTCSSVQQLTPATRKDDLGFRCVLPLKGCRDESESP